MIDPDQEGHSEMAHKKHESLKRQVSKKVIQMIQSLKHSQEFYQEIAQKIENETGEELDMRNIESWVNEALHHLEIKINFPITIGESERIKDIMKKIL
jgi:hypothetical protein